MVAAEKGNPTLSKKKKKRKSSKAKSSTKQAAQATSQPAKVAKETKRTDKAQVADKTDVRGAGVPRREPTWEAPPSGPPKRAWERRLPWLIGLFAFLLYANTLSHLYALDDNLVIYGHKYVEAGIDGIPAIWKTPFTYGATKHNDRGYRPVPLMLFALETELFGKQAFFPQHLIHVLLYVLLCILLFLLLRRLFWKWGPLFPLVVCLLFVAHPIHTEVVANLKSVDEILGLLFGFVLPTWLLFAYFDAEDDAPQRPWLVVALYVSFAIGMFSKENVITYLVVIPMTLLVFGQISWKKVARFCWPLVVIVGGYLAAREAVLNSYPMPEYDMMQNVLMGAKSWLVSTSTAMLVMLKYLWLMVFPHPLAWDYSYKQIVLVNVDDMRVWLSVAIHVALLVYALMHIRSKQLYAYAILFYLTVISVNSNLFVMTNCTLGERFLFTPVLGFCLAATGGLFVLFRLQGASVKKQLASPMLGLVFIVLLFYGGKTFTRNFDWKDTLSLSLADIKTSPKSIRVQSTLAAVYLTLAKREKNKATQRQLYSQILPLAQNILKIQPSHKEASYMLGICYYFFGDFNKAEKAFRSHLKRHPDDTKAYNNLGGLYYFRKQYTTALEYFKKFVKANPKDVKAINNVGVVTMNKLGKLGEALPYFQRAVKIDPNFAEGYKRIGDVWLRRRQLKKALPFYKKAIALDGKRWGYLTPRLATLVRRQKQGRLGRRGMRRRGRRMPGNVRLPPGVRFLRRKGRNKFPPGFRMPPALKRFFERQRRKRRERMRRMQQRRGTLVPKTGPTGTRPAPRPAVSMPR